MGGRAPSYPGMGRVGMLDLLRGLSLVLMVVYHFFYDLTLYCGFPKSVMFHPFINFLQLVFASLFVAMSGATTVFSKSCAKRAVRLLAAAGVVTLATWFFNHQVFVRFGILHFLGVASLIGGLFLRFPALQKVHPFVWLGLFVVSRHLLSGIFPIPHLWMLGIRDAAFSSSDYFPILPWIFMYALGIWFGGKVKSGALPAWFYSVRQVQLQWVGRHPLWIYLLHQPVCMGITLLIARLMGR